MSESTLHIYRAGRQPATKYVVDVSTEIKPFTISHHDRDQLYAMCCRKRRWTKYLTVQVYYDVIYFWCIAGRGCHQVGREGWCRKHKWRCHAVRRSTAVGQ